MTRLSSIAEMAEKAMLGGRDHLGGFVELKPKQIEEIESLSLDLIDELYEGYHSELANVSINVKASIGIAFFPEHGDDSNKVVAAADEAMYFVKKNGKANYHIYQPEDSDMEDLQHTL